MSFVDEMQFRYRDYDPSFDSLPPDYKFACRRIIENAVKNKITHVGGAFSKYETRDCFSIEFYTIDKANVSSKHPQLSTYDIHWIKTACSFDDNDSIIAYLKHLGVVNLHMELISVNISTGILRRIFPDEKSFTYFEFDIPCT